MQNKGLGLLFLFGVLASSLPALSQDAPLKEKVYYYQQILKVSNGQKSRGDLSGQFICFNDQGCYDADKSGYTVNNGFLKYKNDVSGYHTYEGSSFWGTANYCFQNDYSRLNITTPSGVVYVYERRLSPQGQSTSSKIKSNKEKRYNVPLMPIMPVNPYAVFNNNASGTKENDYLKKQADTRVQQIKQSNMDHYNMYRKLYEQEKAEADMYYREYTVHGNTSDLQHSKDCEARATRYLENANIWK